MRCTVIGVGNTYRSDDGVGPLVAAGVAALHVDGLRVVTSSGDPADLLALWQDVDFSVVVDAVVAPKDEPTGHDRPAAIHRFEAQDLLTRSNAATSTHGLGVRESVRLAAALGIPPRLTIIAIEATNTEIGTALSERTRRAVIPATLRVVHEIVRARAVYGH